MPEVNLRIKIDETGNAVLVDTKKKLDDVESSLQKLGQAAKGEATDGMKSLSGQLGPVGSVVASLGPAGIAASAGLAAAGGAALYVGGILKDSVSDAVAYAGHLSDISAKTGMMVEAEQELGHAGSLVGVSLESINSAAFKMQVNLEKTPGAFSEIGLSASDLIKLAPDKAFERTAEALAKITDPAERSAAAVKIFGKGAAEVMPLITSDIASAREEAQRLGLVMGGDTVAALDNLGDATDTLHQTWDGFWRNVGGAIVQNTDLVGAVRQVTAVIGELSSTAQTQGPLIQMAFDIGLPIGNAVRAIDLYQTAVATVVGNDSFFEFEHHIAEGADAAADSLRAAREQAEQLGRMAAVTNGPSGGTGPIGPTPSEIAALDAASKAHAKQLKEAEQAAEKWEKAEVSAVSKIGQHFEQLRAKQDAQEAAHEKYVEAFGKSTEQQQTDIAHLIVNFEDVEEAQDGAFSIEQVSKFRQQLSDLAIEGDSVTENWDELADAGQKVKEKLEEQGEVVEAGNGLWMRKGVAAKEAEDKAKEAVKKTTEELENQKQHLLDIGSTFSGIGGIASDIAGIFEEQIGGRLGKAVGGALGHVQGLASATGDFFKSMATGNIFGMISAAIKAISQLFSLFKGIGSFIGKLFGGGHSFDPSKAEDRAAEQNRPGEGNDAGNYDPNRGSETGHTGGPPSNIPTGPPAGMPQHASGISFVSRTGPAFLHQGETVMPAGGLTELVNEMRAMRGQLLEMTTMLPRLIGQEVAKAVPVV